MKYLIFLLFLVLTSVVNAQSGPMSPAQIRAMFDRQNKMFSSNYSVTFSYVYKNGTPYGKNARITYDKFYKTYNVSFTKQDGMQTGCVIRDNNFISTWEFKYNGKVYELSNNISYH
jgi:negative regulator of sigma E activity